MAVFLRERMDCTRGKARNRRPMGGTEENHIRDSSGLPTGKAVEMK